MPGTNWSEAVEIAVRRLVARTGSADFTRQDMLAQELDRIVRETGSRGRDSGDDAEPVSCNSCATGGRSNFPRRVVIGCLLAPVVSAHGDAE